MPRNLVRLASGTFLIILALSSSSQPLKEADVVRAPTRRSMGQEVRLSLSLKQR